MTTITRPQCIDCRHFRFIGIGTGTCGAFPDGIPFEVYTGEVSHLEPIPGDNGVHFEARDADEPIQVEEPT